MQTSSLASAAAPQLCPLQLMFSIVSASADVLNCVLLSWCSQLRPLQLMFSIVSASVAACAYFSCSSLIASIHIIDITNMHIYFYVVSIFANLDQQTLYTHTLTYTPTNPSPPSRLLGLTFILLLQLWIGWTFLNSQMERAGGEPKLHEPPGKKSGKKSKKNDKTTKSTKPKTSWVELIDAFACIVSF